MFDCQADTPPSGERRSALLRRHLVLLADGQPDLADGEAGVDRVDRAAAAEHREHVVPGHALGAHGPELTIETGPELLQAHPPTLTRTHPGASGPAYARRVFPSTGSGTWDVVLEIGIALALLVTIVVMIRNYRGR